MWIHRVRAGMPVGYIWMSWYVLSSAFVGLSCRVCLLLEVARAGMEACFGLLASIGVGAGWVITP